MKQEADPCLWPFSQRRKGFSHEKRTQTKKQRWAIQWNGHKTWHEQEGQREGATIAERGKRKNTAGADLKCCLQIIKMTKDRNEHQT